MYVPIICSEPLVAITALPSIRHDCTIKIYKIFRDIFSESKSLNYILIDKRHYPKVHIIVCNF